MTRKPKYGDVYREHDDGSLWLFITTDKAHGDGLYYHAQLPLTNSSMESIDALEDITWCKSEDLG